MSPRFLGRLGFLIPKSGVGIIVWKEVLDALRDRRTILMALVLPLVLMPISLVLPVFFISPVRNPPKIAVLMIDEGAGPVVGILSAMPVQITMVAAGENLTALVERNEVDVALSIPGNFTSLIEGDKTAEVALIYDPASMRSETGKGIVDAALTVFSKQVVAARMRKLNVTEAYLEPVEVVSREIKAISQEQFFVAMMLPYFVGISAIIGGAHFATDTTAGEKERKTLEMLLTMPISRIKVVGGKYLGVTMLALVSLMFQLVGMTIGMGLYSTFMGELMGEGATPPSAEASGLPLTPKVVVMIAVSALILSLTGNAILMTAGIFAKTFKEAQQYYGFMSMAMVMPLMATMFLPPATIEKTLVLPIMGPVGLIKGAILNTATTAHIFLALGSSLAYLSFFLFLTTRIFSKESVLFRV